MNFSDHTASGGARPSKSNEQAFGHAVDQVASVARQLLDQLVTNAAPRDREAEAQKARARSAKRFLKDAGQAAER